MLCTKAGTFWVFSRTAVAHVGMSATIAIILLISVVGVLYSGSSDRCSARSFSTMLVNTSDFDLLGDLIASDRKLVLF